MAFASLKYSRSNFFGSVIDPNGNIIQDITSFKFSNFYEYMRNQKVAVHSVTRMDANLPDLISFLEYGGDHQYWWILLLLNKIQDPFTGLPTGTNLAVPSIQNINAFYQSKRTGAAAVKVTKI